MTLANKEAAIHPLYLFTWLLKKASIRKPSDGFSCPQNSSPFSKVIVFRNLDFTGSNSV
jgi:hypothetical protein